MDRVECIVVGAGVVGLAVGRALAAAGREVVVLEAEKAIGTGISSRNSEVIHAGIYYAAGSLKAKLCVRGRDLLYDYCADRGIAHKRLGKLIVAASADEVAYLEGLAARGRANGVDDLTLLDAAAVRALEPELSAHAALLSPSTGIVDSHGLMLALQGEIEDAGGAIAFAAPFEGAEPDGDGLVVTVGGETPMTLGCRHLVNAAGLDATGLAACIAGLDAGFVPGLALAKGNYFSCTRKAPFRHLIYPVPEAGGLGTHLTLDLGGQARFGPDVEWVDTRAYEVDPARKSLMLASIRRYWPAVTADDLIPAYSGIRPKLEPRSVVADFVIQGPGVHGVAGLINLFGIESPGLTASLALGEATAEQVAAQG